MIEIGQKAPDVSFDITGEKPVKASEFLGKKMILFFYPKDNTSGCTKAAIGFSDAKALFEAQNTKIIGISPDDHTSHEKFIQKHNLTVSLAADPERRIIETYGLWVEKKMYGRSYMGVERTTVLIDETGIITTIWRKVKVTGHVEAVLKEITANSAS